ncbi:MAG: hypothetical protein KC776_42135 [Myxococcales bacterium]|nr:hypothetical protein [Myxococcales bacterium]MCB9577412.1 hypothetical protein [Polyangiaceae bacterium]
MPTLKSVMKQNRGIVGHLTVAEALELEPEDVAEWADEVGLPQVDGVRVFGTNDLAALEQSLEDSEDDQGDESDQMLDGADDHDDDRDDPEDDDRDDED